MKKFTGSQFTLTPDKSVVAIDSGYDCFPKHCKITVPEGFTAILLQNGKHACNGSDTFTIASRKSSGLKLPLFGKYVKTQIMFVRLKIEYVFQADGEKIKVAGRDARMKALCYYTLEMKSVNNWMRFLDNLKLKPGTGGVIATKDDISYIMHTVLPQFLRTGYTGTDYSPRTADQKAYYAFIEDIFKNKLCQPFGFACTRLGLNLFRVE